MTLFVAIAALALAVLALVGVCALLPQVYRDREYRDEVEPDTETEQP